MEETKDSQLKLPPFLKIDREITDDSKYYSKNLANKGFEMQF
jgi:CYTH domain-containing protein